MAVPAGGVVPGQNGKIVFTSGRPPVADDAHAQLWTVDAPGGTPVQLTDNSIFPDQHRHSSWSPDNHFLAYAYGTAGAWDLELKDLVVGGGSVNISFLDGGFQDRPAFSPDGTRIAYESTQVAGQGKNIFIKTLANPGAPGLQLTTQPVNQDAGKPTWSADSQFVFYGVDVDPGAGVNNDIVKEPADNSGAPVGVITGATDDYQPAMSADGQNLCFTRGAFGTTAATVQRATSAGGGVTQIENTGSGNYNCAWSPDGTKIACVTGIFGNGALMMKNSDGTGVSTLVVNDVPARFDGNPDWAVDPPPTCTNVGPVSVPHNGSATIQLTCSDPDNQALTYSIVTNPTKGTLSNLNAATGTVTYTANNGQTGTDVPPSRRTTASRIPTRRRPRCRSPLRRQPAVAAMPEASNGEGGGEEAGGGGSGANATAATISAVQVGRSDSGAHGSLRGRRGGSRTTISFSLDKDAAARLTFAKVTKGRRVGRRCVARTRANAQRPSCTRLKSARGAIAVAGKAGVNRVKFSGRITRASVLGLGPYRVIVSATDAAGNRSTEGRQLPDRAEVMVT
jgi:hypothetical protein